MKNNIYYFLLVLFLVNSSCYTKIKDINKCEITLEEHILPDGGSFYYHFKNDKLTIKHDYLYNENNYYEKDTSFSIKLSKEKINKINKLIPLLVKLDNEYVNRNIIDGFIISLEFKENNKIIKEIIIDNSKSPKVVDSLMSIFYLEYPFPICRGR